MIHFNKFILDNGLRVIHHENKNVSMVIVNTLYDVGSKDETTDNAGFAHLFEHLMFGGTEANPNFDEPIQIAGGENNACTSYDYTNYYINIPYNNVETAFYLEADRMNKLAFSQHSLDVQRNVVCEEFKQRCLNQPYGNLYHALRKLCFSNGHPYGWPPIGLTLDHIEKASINDVETFFYQHYAPNNAILSVVGNISLEETKRMVEKWYGAIPQRQIAPRVIPSNPHSATNQLLVMEEDVPVSLYYRMYHIGGRKSNDYFVSDFVSDILSNGKSSRMEQRLVRDKKIFTATNAYISGDIEAGLFIFNGEFATGTTIELAQEAIDETIHQTMNEKIDDLEIEKMRNKKEVEQISLPLNLENLAHRLAYNELLGDADSINHETEAYNNVTFNEAMDFCQRTFTEENKAHLYYKAKN